MQTLKRPKKIDYSLFKKNNSNLKTRYGLPRDITFCKSCVISNQRPISSIEFKNTINQNKNVIRFNQHGICDACKFAEKKKEN